MRATSTTTTATQAAELAREALAHVDARLAHSTRVARQAEQVQHLLAEPWASAILDAAWLHDIGYSPEISDAGFHPIDGARWLRQQGWSIEVCRLVAWHTRARTEAGLRGLGDELEAEFAPPPALAQAAMTWADLTSSRNGECCTVDERLADIMRRYPPGTVVHDATACNLPDLLASVRLIAEKLSVLGSAEP